MVKRSVVLFLLILLLGGLLFEAYFDTPTYDEPANMAAAYDYTYRNDFRIYPDNPPLVKILAGLAVLPVRNKINFPSNLSVYEDPQKFDLYAFGREFLYKSGNDTRMIIFLMRLPNILFTIGLGFLLYLFAVKLYGRGAGLLVLFLYALDPNIRGHGHILAFDIPLAFIIVLILYLTFHLSSLGRLGLPAQAGNIRYILLISLVFALGFLTKFTFLFFAFFYFCGLFLFGKKEWRITLKDKLMLLISVGIVSYSLLWVFGLMTNYNRETLDYDKVPIIVSGNKTLENDFKWNLFKNLPVPYHYKTGMMVMYTHDIVSQPAFLLGKVHAKNDWFFYFPISFLLKVPIPTLIFIFWAMFIVGRKIKRREKLLVRDYFPFLLGSAFMLSMMLFSHINNVYRYLFPAFSLFILGASQIVTSLLSTGDASPKKICEQIFQGKRGLYFPERLPRKKLSSFYGGRTRKLQLLFIYSFCLYLILTSFFSFPYDLSYTNEFTGIPPQGYRYLSDSEVDWGQDLERLAVWLRKNNFDKETITLSYLGTADPEYYGIKYRPLKFEDLDNLPAQAGLSGIVAISVGNLTLGDWQWRSRPDYRPGFIQAPLDNLRRKTPDAVIGKSIFVYTHLTPVPI